MRIRLALVTAALALPVLAATQAQAGPPTVDPPVGVTVTSEEACVTISKMVPQCVPLHWSPA